MIDLSKIPFKKSPNFAPGRRGLPIKYLVIHAMQGTYQGSIAWFMNPKSQVSAHYCVSATGDVIQMVNDLDRAWHVGEANGLSLGIELQDDGDCLKNTAWITPELWQTSTELAAVLCKKHSIAVENVVGHNSKVMRSFHNTHSDPGLLDMDKFRSAVSGLLNG